MKFNDHWKLKDQHALFGASKYHWINYTNDKIVQTYFNSLKAEEGTQLHALASECIKHNRRQAGDDMFATFVNDAIGFKMSSEQVLFFSENFFGTADAICFYNNILRIHDLKTGVSPTHMEQLMIYAALFCLEYGKNPKDISIELRIYQDNENNEVPCVVPDPNEIMTIMNRMIEIDKMIKKIKEEA